MISRKMKKQLADQLNEKFRELTVAQFRRKFNLELVTEFNILEMRLISRRADDKKLTPHQKDFLQALDDGYTAAWNVVSSIVK